jgi:hypothetical protein
VTQVGQEACRADAADPRREPLLPSGIVDVGHAAIVVTASRFTVPNGRCGALRPVPEMPIRTVVDAVISCGPAGPLGAGCHGSVPAGTSSCGGDLGPVRLWHRARERPAAERNLSGLEGLNGSRVITSDDAVVSLTTEIAVIPLDVDQIASRLIEWTAPAEG